MSVDLRHAARALWELRARCGPAALERALGGLPPADIDEISRCWQLIARPKQLRPVGCRPIWLRKAGRGEGKTRSAAERTLDRCEDHGPNLIGALVSKSVGDVRDVMIEGVSGLQSCARRRGYDVQYVANRALVVHPSGATYHVMSAESAEFGRGPNINDFWADEIAAWPHNALERFKVFTMSWRLKIEGVPLEAVITTTPKPCAIMQYLLRAREMAEMVTVTGGRTIDNAANIDASRLLAMYSGTTLGRQELDGEMLESGALVTIDTIHRYRVRVAPESLSRVVVAVDPGIRKNENADATGIIVAGADHQYPPDAYLLADETMQGAGFADWAKLAVDLALEWGAEEIVTEINQGGDAVTDAVHAAIAGDPWARSRGAESIRVTGVWSEKSKRTRAEPVAIHYERGRVHHVGIFDKLEEEWSTWAEGAASPNRLDAAVYAITNLIGGEPDDAPLWTPH